jgi:hypothetical protein
MMIAVARSSHTPPNVHGSHNVFLAVILSLGAES